MLLRHLSLVDFRSHASVELALSAGANSLVGRNGAGKTNIVEAMGYLSSLQSHRVSNDAPLVREGATQAIVRGLLERDGRDILLEVEINPGRANRARINRSPAAKAKDVLGLLRTVLFAPEDLALVKGDPAGRRRFVDELLVARNPRYAGVISDYERVLRQRNTLLKSAAAARRGGDLSTLEVWDSHLAIHGSELLAGRLDVVAALAPCAAKSHDQVADSAATLSLAYRSSIGVAKGDTESLGLIELEGATREELEQLLLTDIARLRKAELDRGVSLVGPHRDELLLTLGAFPAKGYASHGESWSVALALRLGSYELLRSDGGEPVLMLDDVFAELDTRRRESLASLVADSEQVIVTAAVAQDVPGALLGTRISVGAEGVVRDE